MRKRYSILLGLIAVYAAAGIIATPKIRHSWWYLQENANRRFSTFCGLSAASCLFPWCIPAGIESYRNMCERGVPSRMDPELFSLALGVGKELEHVDARVMTMSRFKALMEDFKESRGSCRVWCFGRFDYCFTPASNVSFDRLLTLFSDEKMFERFAAARIYTPAALFACYVGDYEDVAPAFSQVPSHGRFMDFMTSSRVLFRPESTGALSPVNVAKFTPFDIKFPSWVSRGSADAKMFIDFEDCFENVQEARREALLGFDYAQCGMASNAIACWAKAASVNPRDPVLIELADALDKEARSYLAIGNVNGALQCYENRLQVFPKDPASVHNFGVCLKKAGHHKVAARVFARAVELDPAHDEHRIELADCADAAGYYDVAVKQIDFLLKKHPEDVELKKRRANILVRMHFEKAKRKPAREDNTPSRYLDKKTKKRK
ncbi:MAG: tetratricopeptide repeat protein [Kiritimatiellae bacterium]|nr:tetratricopeptide repeat protein [Kiritimatiellia bacterium]